VLEKARRNPGFFCEFFGELLQHVGNPASGQEAAQFIKPRFVVPLNLVDLSNHFS
jgi:hypothetical protein